MEKNGYVACFKTPEESEIGTQVGSISATDPDANDDLTFTIVSGNLRSAFSLHAQSGKILVEKDFLNHEDFSTQGQYKLQVQVKDSRGLFTTGMVLIEIEDINEPPKFTEGGSVRTVYENSAPGTFIGEPIAASDPDYSSTIFGQFVFSLIDGNLSSYANMTVNGQIIVNRKNKSNVIDFEKSEFLEGEVQVQDLGGLSAYIDVLVRVLDINEVPEFQSEKIVCNPTFIYGSNLVVKLHVATHPWAQTYGYLGLRTSTDGAWSSEYLTPRGFFRESLFVRS